MNIQMRNEQLLVEKIEKPKCVDNGVIYTQDQGMISFEAKIIATFNNELFPINDIVIFYEKAAEPVVIDDHKYLMLDSQNVWAVRSVQ